jgi:hypothetical protein
MKTTLLIAAIAGTTLTGLATAAETIKVAYAYTSSVSSYYGGDDNTRSKINSKHSLTTELYSNSPTGVTFVKGPSYKATAYTATNVTSAQAINNLRNHANLQGARDTRDSSNSDIMQFFCDWTNSVTLGIAETPGWCSAVRKNVLGSTSGNAKFTPGHEIGHNTNATHEHGFCLSMNRRTVMEPNDGTCSSYTRINYFSQSIVGMGNSSNDNNKRVVNQSPTTARYRN